MTFLMMVKLTTINLFLCKFLFAIFQFYYYFFLLVTNTLGVSANSRECQYRTGRIPNLNLAGLTNERFSKVPLQDPF